jgi:hypothetical protein
MKKITILLTLCLMLAGCTELDAGSLAEENAGGDLTLYLFTGEDDSSGNPGADINDYLIRITMDQGQDIGWSSISIKIEIDGGVPVTCDNPGVEGTGDCVLEEFGTDTTDSVLSAGDGFRIKENGQNLCNAACSIDVTITDVVEGKVIDQTSAYAE